MTSWVEFLCLLALCFTPCTTTCTGNDSRCPGKDETECNQLEKDGTDCEWDGSAATTSTAYEPEPAPSSEYTTSVEPHPASEASITTSIEPQPASEASITTSIEPGPEPASEASITTSIEPEAEPASDPETTSSLIEPETSSSGAETTSIQADTTGNPDQGKCSGNDSRCAGSTQSQCTQLATNTDCRWEGSTNTGGAEGECSGNDSRCEGKAIATCNRLSSQGSDCKWTYSTPFLPVGTCSGNDSRCSGKAENSCNDLTDQKVDCKWVETFIAAGSLTVTVNNASDFISNPNSTVAIKAGLANHTGLPPTAIDVDLHEVVNVTDRRLHARELAQTATILVTYVMVVGSDVLASVSVTGTEIAELMQASNVDQIGAAISAAVKETFGNDNFIVVVTSVAPVVLVSSSVTTTFVSQTRGPDNLFEEDGALLIGCTYPLLAVLGITAYLF